MHIPYGVVSAVIGGSHSTATSHTMGGFAVVTGDTMMDDDNGNR
jgi:hypothetical protein